MTPVPVTFPALTGSNVKITIDSVAPHQFLDYLSNSDNTDRWPSPKWASPVSRR